MVAAHRSAAVHSRGREENIGSIYTPASFNYQLATGPGTLVTKSLEGVVKVLGIRVGVKAGWSGSTNSDTEGESR